MIRKLIRTIWPRYIFKDARTGKIVTKAYAKANPDVTYRLRIW